MIVKLHTRVKATHVGIVEAGGIVIGDWRIRRDMVYVKLETGVKINAVNKTVAKSMLEKHFKKGWA